MYEQEASLRKGVKIQKRENEFFDWRSVRPSTVICMEIKPKNRDWWNSICSEHDKMEEAI